MRRVYAVGLVALQFLLLGALVFLPHGRLWPVTLALVAGAVLLCLLGATLAALGILGLGPALTASPIPRENAPLVTTGVYGLVRSPIYAGLLLGAIGLGLVGASAWHIAAWVALVVLLSAKTRWEERMLLAEHPDYAAYGARVGRFLPGIGKLRPRR